MPEGEHTPGKEEERLTKARRWCFAWGVVLVCVSLRYMLDPHFHPITWILGCLAGIAIGVTMALNVTDPRGEQSR